MVMKTTLDIDDRLLREAKKLAAERGVTLTSVVEEGLRSVVTAPIPKPYTLDWPPIESTEPLPFDMDSRVAMYEWFDENP